ncbi:hypothetical protein Sjap_017415 [Stephania japonica]|uniref:Aminotransferase class V domain-containing protein n=1 Tax=Stephania japonica TaxID=461633 RepID=A0AAP0I653_9MAGN
MSGLELHRKPITKSQSNASNKKIRHAKLTRPTFHDKDEVPSTDKEENNRERDDAENDDLNFVKVAFGDVNSEGTDGEDKCSWLRSQLIGDGVEIRTPFGKRCLTYADYTASGRSLHHVENFIVDKVLPYYGNTHTEDSYVGHRTTKMVNAAVKYVKRCMGGGPKDVLLFCGSGATAAIKRLQEVMGITVPSILRTKAVRELVKPEERWVVFVGPYEHHSNLLSWRESLADVVEIGATKDGLIDVNMLRRELQSRKHLKRPMLGSFSACSNVTGICTNTRAIARVLHEHGAFACFDFATSGPYVKIDFRSGAIDGYDAVFLSTHKFVGGPGAPGILLMNKALYKLRSAPPSTCGGGTVCYVNGFNKKDTLYLDDIEEREDAGTPAIIQKIRAALAFSVKEYVGYQMIEPQEKLWVQTALKRFMPNPSIRVLGNTSVRRQPVISFLINTTSLDDNHETHHEQIEGRMETHMMKGGGLKKDKPLNCRFVAKLLNDLFGIQARGGCACAGPYGHLLLDIGKKQSLALRAAIQKGYNGVKAGWTRISFIYYMSRAEFDFILNAIEFIAQYGQRFLPLYNFNWKTGDWTFGKSSIKNRLGNQELETALDSLNLGTIRAFASAGDADGGQNLHHDYSSRDSRHQTISETNGNMDIKYMAYLETAHRVAQLLPKFPSQRSLPKGIDPDILHFKI